MVKPYLENNNNQVLPTSKDFTNYTILSATDQERSYIQRPLYNGEYESGNFTLSESNITGRGLYANPFGYNQISNNNFTGGQVTKNIPDIMKSAYFPSTCGATSPPQLDRQIPITRIGESLRN